MATAAGIIITAGAITLASEALVEPGTATNPLSEINWRVIPATAIAAFIFSGIESVNGPVGRMLAVMALITTLTVSTSKHSAPIVTFATVMGYQKGSVYYAPNAKTNYGFTSFTDQGA